jgi:hypothetical protein
LATVPEAADAWLEPQAAVGTSFGAEGWPAAWAAYGVLIERRIIRREHKMALLVQTLI